MKAFERQLGQGSKSDFVYGPFHPAGAKKQEVDDHSVREERKSIQDWENLVVSFRPQYRNQGFRQQFYRSQDMILLNLLPGWIELTVFPTFSCCNAERSLWSLCGCMENMV